MRRPPHTRSVAAAMVTLVAIGLLGSAADGKEPTELAWGQGAAVQLTDTVVNGLEPYELHRVVLQLNWRNLMNDRADARKRLDLLAAAAGRDPLMAAVVRSYRGRFAVEEGRVGQARELFRASGGVEAWWAHGPAPLGELTDLETLEPPTGDMEWRPVAGTDPGGWVDLSGVGWPSERQVVFLACTVEADRVVPVAVRLGVAQGAVVWLNGNRLLSTPQPVARGEDQFSVGGWLEPGPNVLVVAVGVERGGWWNRARLTAPDGDMLRGARVVSRRPVEVTAARREPPMVRTLENDLREASARGDESARVALAALLTTRRPYAEDSGAGRQACRDARDEATAAALWFEWMVSDEPRTQYELLQEIVRRAPRWIPARIELGRWLRQRDLVAEALAVLTVEDPPSALQAARIDLGGWGELSAIQLERLHANAPSCVAVALTLLHRALDEDRIGLARRALEDLRLLVPGDAAVRHEAMRLAARTANGGALLDAAEGSVDHDANDPAARVRLARLLIGASRPDRARRVLENGLERCPPHPDLLMELARLEHREGRVTEAELLVRELLTRRPQEDRARHFLELLGRESEDRGWCRTPDELRTLAHGVEGSEPFRGLVLHHEIRVLPDELLEERVQRVFLVRDPARSDDLRRRTIPYVPERQRLRVLSARVLRGGGELSARQGDTPRLAEPEVRLYYDTRLRVLEMPRLEAGDLVEVTYILSETAESNETGAYSGGLVPLSVEVPMERVELILDAPTGELPAWELVGADAEVRRQGEDGRDHVEMTLSELAAVPVEVPAAPPLLVMPHLVYSTRGDWPQLARWYSRHVGPKLRSSEAISRTAARLTAAGESRKDHIRSIYRFVTDEIRYVGLEFGEHRFRPFSADWVLRHRMGDCKDKTALLVVLLREVGISAHPVLVRTANRGPFPSNVAALEAFNHVIAYLPEEDLWLDGTATDHDLDVPPAADHGAMALVIDVGQAVPETIPTDPAAVRRHEFRIERGEDGLLNVSVTAVSTGTAAVVLRHRLGGSQDPHRIERWLHQWFPGARVVGTPDLQLKPGVDPAVAHVSATVPRSSLLASGGVAAYPGSLDFVSSLTPTDTRSTPVLLPSHPVLRWTLEVDVGKRPEDLPSTVEHTAPYGAARVAYESTGTGYRIAGSVELGPGVVPAEQTDELRQFVLAVVRAAERRLEVP